MNNTLALHWLLRLAVLMEFVGHGAFGYIGKHGWIPYFQVFGFSDSWAWLTMPLVGTVDIFIGLYSFCFPRRILFLYMAFWGCLTAMLRPLSGEPVWEFVERAYNMGVPFLFLILHDQKWTWASLFSIISPPKRAEILSESQLKKLLIAIQLICAGMLIGHGLLALVVQKPLLLNHLISAELNGFFNRDAYRLLEIQGFLEIAAGIAVLISPNRKLLLMIFIWKVVTEGLFFSTEAVGVGWEWIERGGAYIAPLLGMIVISSIQQDGKTHQFGLVSLISKLNLNSNLVLILNIRSKK